MVKIEKFIGAGAVAFINTKDQVFEGQLISREELNSIKVENGSLVVSIDEKELKLIRSDSALQEEELKKQKELEEQKELHKQEQLEKAAELAKIAEYNRIQKLKEQEAAKNTPKIDPKTNSSTTKK